MRRLTLSVLLALLALPASAHAGFFPAEVIDGPNAELLEVGDLDLARDGQGGVVYTRRDAGVPHVFFSRFTDGAFQGPVRVDNGIAGTSSDPVLGSSDNNRLAVAWVTDGALFTAVKAKDATGFAAPVQVDTGGVSNPSIDVSINGATYVSYTKAGSIFVARAERDQPNFTIVPAPLNVNAGAPAGETERKASKVDVSADGTAVVVWGEAHPDGRTHVYARRVFETRLSTAPQDLTLDSVEGVQAGSADSPQLDMEDDSSYAQVTFRQQTAGSPRLIMRRLVGTTFDPPVLVDGGLPGDRAVVDLNGRGEGLFAFSSAGGEVAGGTIFANKISGQTRLNGPNGVPPRASAAVGENEDGAVTWMQGNSPNEAGVVSRYFTGVEFIKLAEEAVLSRPEFGPVYAAGGLDSESSRAGDVAMVFMQGGAGDRRLVAGVYDKPPTRIAGANSQKIRKLTRLAWGNSLNLFGGTKYTVIVDGKPVGETGQNNLIPQPGQIPDGEHTWQIQIADRRGQSVVSRTRRLRVDNTPPTLRVSMRKRGRVLTVTGRGGDPAGALPSGLGRVLVDFGDGELVPTRRGKASKRFSRSGSFRIRVKAVDKAGNETNTTRRVSIGR